MYRISQGVSTTHGQDGAVVLDIQQGRVLRLNVTGAFIFQHLERGETESQISEELSQHFCVSRDVAQADVSEFLTSMETTGLVSNDTARILP